MNLRGAMTCAVLAQTLACDSRSDDAVVTDTASARTTVPADSLVATTPGGVEIWFTLSREAKAADGSGCIDRAIEIRNGDRRVPVPLLYTGTAPEIVNDTTMRARLSNHCVPGDAYLVDLRTGRPVPERR